MSVLGKIGRGIFNVLGIVELVVDGYDLVAGWFKKPSRKVKDLLDAQEDDEVIPLRRVIRPPPIKAKPGGGAPPRGPAR
jgi:hypothetical protein